ncbi:MAG: hypothetical protein U9M95_00720 [Candidatus Altiarchaeota archaeon]|nr:hypothetical protein [Candidatus Altiarchaeota archaeon]
MTINYAELQRIYRSEKKTPSLCNVEGDFYSRLNELISHVSEEHRDSIEKLAEEIHLRRRNKVLMQVIRSMDTEPLNSLPSEKKLYWALVDVLKEHAGSGFMGGDESSGGVDNGVRLEDVEDNEEKIEKPEVEDDMVRLRIVKGVPSIVGSDARNYGPFNAGQEVELPKKTANILLEWEVAEKI